MLVFCLSAVQYDSWLTVCWWDFHVTTAVLHRSVKMWKFLFYLSHASSSILDKISNEMGYNNANANLGNSCETVELMTHDGFLQFVVSFHSACQQRESALFSCSLNLMQCKRLSVLPVFQAKDSTKSSSSSDGSEHEVSALAFLTQQIVLLCSQMFRNRSVSLSRQLHLPIRMLGKNSPTTFQLLKTSVSALLLCCMLHKRHWRWTHERANASCAFFGSM